MSEYDYTRLPDGSRRSPGAIRYPVTVFEGGRPAGQVTIVREQRVGQVRHLFDAAGTRYSARKTGLGVEEVQT